MTNSFKCFLSHEGERPPPLKLQATLRISHSRRFKEQPSKRCITEAVIVEFIILYADDTTAMIVFVATAKILSFESIFFWEIILQQNILNNKFIIIALKEFCLKYVLIQYTRFSKLLFFHSKIDLYLIYHKALFIYPLMALKVDVIYVNNDIMIV